jgi:hypothetical protein
METSFEASFRTSRFFVSRHSPWGYLADTKTQAQPAGEAWVRSYNGQAESDDRARKTVLDALGNVFVVGSSDAGINGSDWLILKYSSAACRCGRIVTPDRTTALIAPTRGCGQ